MRTTVTLDVDVAAKVQDLMRERGISFKEAINQTLRIGFGQKARSKRYEVPARRLGLKPGIDITKALQMATDMEDQANLRDLEERK